MESSPYKLLKVNVIQQIMFLKKYLFYYYLLLGFSVLNDVVSTIFVFEFKVIQIKQLSINPKKKWQSLITFSLQNTSSLQCGMYQFNTSFCRIYRHAQNIFTFFHPIYIEFDCARRWSGAHYLDILYERHTQT